MTMPRPVGPATPQESDAPSAPIAPSEPIAPSAPIASSEPGAPRWRSLRGWAVAAAQTLVCLGLGGLIYLVVLGDLLLEFDDSPPSGLLAMSAVDAVVGIGASLAVGTLRFLRPGRLHATVHLLLTAVAGLSVWSVPAAAIALYRLGLRRRLLLDVAAVALLAAVAAAWLALDMRLRGETDLRLLSAALGVMAVGALVPLLIGRVVGTRHELIRTLRERAAAAERERVSAERERASAEQARLSAQREADALRLGRDAESARVRAEERAALARDMHDSVSHHLASIAMHAGAMSYREDLAPETLRETARTVRDDAQQANRELREVLVALRTTADAAPLATVPTLQEAVDRARAGGQEVSFALEGLGAEELEELGRGTVVALARILAEALTNAAKHAPGRPVTALLARRDGRVVLTVGNPLARTVTEAAADVPDAGGGAADGADTVGGANAPSTGHGLIGVEERAHLLGGGARWRRHAESFEVEAWLPW